MANNSIKWRVDVKLLFAPTRTESLIVEAKTRGRAERLALKKAKSLYEAPIFVVTASQGLVD